MKYRCYGLFATDEPMKIRRVGCTAEPIERSVIPHQGGAVNVAAWIQEVRLRGAHVETRELSTHSNLQEADEAEANWKDFWSKQGELINAGTAKAKPEARDPAAEALFRRGYYLLLKKHGPAIANVILDSWRRDAGYELPLTDENNP